MRIPYCCQKHGLPISTPIVASDDVLSLFLDDIKMHVRVSVADTLSVGARTVGDPLKIILTTFSIFAFCDLPLYAATLACEVPMPFRVDRSFAVTLVSPTPQEFYATLFDIGRDFGFPPGSRVLVDAARIRRDDDDDAADDDMAFSSTTNDAGCLAIIPPSGDIQPGLVDVLETNMSVMPYFVFVRMMLANIGQQGARELIAAALRTAADIDNPNANAVSALLDQVRMSHPMELGGAPIRFAVEAGRDQFIALPANWLTSFYAAIGLLPADPSRCVLTIKVAETLKLLQMEMLPSFNA
jgi:hypothetical protein